MTRTSPKQPKEGDRMFGFLKRRKAPTISLAEQINDLGYHTATQAVDIEQLQVQCNEIHELLLETRRSMRKTHQEIQNVEGRIVHLLEEMDVVQEGDHEYLVRDVGKALEAFDQLTEYLGVGFYQVPAHVEIHALDPQTDSPPTNGDTNEPQTEETANG